MRTSSTNAGMFQQAMFEYRKGINPPEILDGLFFPAGKDSVGSSSHPNQNLFACSSVKLYTGKPLCLPAHTANGRCMSKITHSDTMHKIQILYIPAISPRPSNYDYLILVMLIAFALSSNYSLIMFPQYLLGLLLCNT